MDSERTFLHDLMLSAAFGLVIAFFTLFLSGGLWASWTAGIVFCLSGVVFGRTYGTRGHLATVMQATLAGALAGAGWWVVADVPTSWWIAPAVGAALAFVEVGLWEWRDWKRDRDAVPYHPPKPASSDGAS